MEQRGAGPACGLAATEGDPVGLFIADPPGLPRSAGFCREDALWAWPLGAAI